MTPKKTKHKIIILNHQKNKNRMILKERNRKTIFKTKISK